MTRTALLALLVACGEPPVGTFTVDCADDDCTQTRFTAIDQGTTTAFAWLVDGRPVGTGREYVRDLDLEVAELVRLEATSPGGYAGSQVWVAGNPAVSQDAVGGFVQEAVGILTVGGDRTVDIECGPLTVVNSIGGCFTGTQPVDLYFSNPSTDSSPPPLTSSNYAAPAHFAATPAVTRGGWDAARAVLSTDTVDDGWGSLASVDTTIPRFEAAFTPPTTGEGTWVVATALQRPRTLHRQALFVACDEESLTVDSYKVPDATLAEWYGKTK